MTIQNISFIFKYNFYCFTYFIVYSWYYFLINFIFIDFRALRIDLIIEYSLCEEDHVDYKDRSIKMTSNKQTASSWLLRSCKRSRFKIELLYFIFAYLLPHCSARNNPPRFLIDGQTEIVLRLKEGPETPIGKDIFLKL